MSQNCSLFRYVWQLVGCKLQVNNFAAISDEKQVIIGYHICWRKIVIVHHS